MSKQYEVGDAYVCGNIKYVFDGLHWVSEYTDAINFGSWITSTNSIKHWFHEEPILAHKFISSSEPKRFSKELLRRWVG